MDTLEIEKKEARLNIENWIKEAGAINVVRGQHSSVAESERKHRSGYL